MSYAAHRKDFATSMDAPTHRSEAGKPKTVGLVRRLYDFISQSRQREADRVIGAYLARSGGKLTDSAEREMMQHLTGSSWRKVGW